MVRRLCEAENKSGEGIKMERDAVLALLKEGADFVLLARKDQSIADCLIDIESREPSAVKYAAEKAIRDISEREPGLLAGREEKLFSLLKSENTFIRLGSIISCANLSALGTERVKELLKKNYLPFLYSDNVAEFGNAALSVPKILKAFPEMEGELMKGLFNVTERVFLHKGKESEECRNVASGKALDVFLKMDKGSPYRQEMLEFAEKNLKSTRNSTRRKGERLLKKLKG